MAIRSVCFVLTVCMGCASPSEPVNCLAAPLSRINVFDKLDFLGAWEHTVRIQYAPPSSPFAVGATHNGGNLTWELDEDLLFARDAEANVVLGFRVDGHFTLGFDDEGMTCFADDVRGWAERRYVRVDWSIDLVAESSNLPMGDVVDTWESVYPDDYGEPPLFTTNDEGQVEEIRLFVDYAAWDDCAGCPLHELRVEHVLTRREST